MNVALAVLACMALVIFVLVVIREIRWERKMRRERDRALRLRNIRYNSAGIIRRDVQ